MPCCIEYRRASYLAMSRSRTGVIGSLLALVAALTGVVVVGYLLSSRFLEPMS